jgi:hypothetical protein
MSCEFSRLLHTASCCALGLLTASVLVLPALAQDAAATPAATAPAATAPAAPAAAPAEASAPAAAAPAAPAAPAAQTASATPAQPKAPDATKLVTPEVIATVRKLLEQPVTAISVNASNVEHAKLDQAGIDALDGAWKAQAKADDQPMIAELLSSPLSNYLLYLQASSAGLYTEMFVMDNKGLNVGQSSVTSDYWQGDEAKYQKTFLIGPQASFIDEPEFNDDTKTWRVQVDFTINDPQSGKPIGAAAIEFNLTELERRKALAM